jgi:general stress protein 26
MSEDKHTEQLRKLNELIKNARICMFTTMTPEGRHVARPMGLQEVEFDGDLWFLTEQSSPKVAEFQQHPQVNISISDQKHNAWVSVSGTAELLHDRAKIEELWSPFYKAYFPQGLDTPGLALIKVHADTAEYWDSPGGAVVQLFGFVKAAVTGRSTDLGENEVVQLP